jgi:hypothetical protein
MGYGDEMAGPTGELLGEGIGDAIASGNYAQIQKMLADLRAQYAALPGKAPLGPVPVGQSALGSVVEDPRYGGAENEALRRLMEISASGGMTAADKARLEHGKLAGLAVSRGMRGATEDSMRRRGVYGSGAELASDLSGQQAGINTAYQGDVATSAAASERALEALKAGGGLANQLGSRDLTQKDMAASANDRISQFNANRMDASDLYNSGLAQANALARLAGTGAMDQQTMQLLASLAKQLSSKGGGYGRQLGDLFGSAGGGSGGTGGGSDPSEWNQYPGGSGEDSNTYGGYKLTDEEDPYATAGAADAYDPSGGYYG